VGLALEIIVLLVVLAVVGVFGWRAFHWLYMNTDLAPGLLGVAAISLLFGWAETSRPTGAEYSVGLAAGVAGVCVFGAGIEALSVVRRQHRREREERDHWKARAFELEDERRSDE
jgi:hypothetical protein